MSKKRYCGRKRPSQFQPALEAEALNDLTYNFYYNRLARIALAMFEWENLPLSMNGEWLEWCLFQDGQAAILYDEEAGGFINTRSTVAGDLNIYGRPIKIQCYSYRFHDIREVYNGLQTAIHKNSQAILVENMIQRVPTLPTLELFAYRLTEAQRSEDVNIKNQKFPLYIPTSDKQRFSVLNAYEQYDGNTPVIIGDKENLGLENWKAIKTDVPFVADKIQHYRRKIWNEALEFLGVNSVAEEKKERLITNEAEANNECTNLNLMAFLVPRQRACRYFNEKYGFTGTDKEISVKVRSDLMNVIKQEESIVNSVISDPRGDNE